MIADIFAVAFFTAWTVILWNVVRRVDARLRSAIEFRAAAVLLDARCNG